MTNNEPKLPCPPLITSKQNWDGVYLQHDRQPPFEIPRHTHAEHTLIIGMDNALSAEWSIDGQFRDLQYNRGDVFVVPAGVPHKAYWKQESEGIMLALKPESVINAAIDSVNSDRLEITSQFASTDKRLFQIVQWLLMELRLKQMGSNIYAESLITMIKVHLLRTYSVIQPTIPDYRGGLAKHKQKRAIAFINENLDCDLKLAQIAGLIEMSPYHFARMFKQSTGLSPHQYLVRQRLVKAKELLRYSDMAIADIAYTVGYKNPSHFAKVFRKHLKVSPTEYRNIVAF